MKFGENSGHGYAIKAQYTLQASLRFPHWQMLHPAGNQNNVRSRLHSPGASSHRKIVATKVVVTSWRFSSRRTARSSVGFKNCARRASRNLPIRWRLHLSTPSIVPPLMATSFGVESWINLPVESFQGICPHCGVDLYLVIGKYGYFATAEDWVKPGKSSGKVQVRPGVKLAPIEPARVALPSTGQWMYDRCVAADHAELAECIKYLFGKSTCTECGENFVVQEGRRREGPGTPANKPLHLTAAALRSFPRFNVSPSRRSR